MSSTQVVFRPFTEATRARVSSLYRRSLRTSLDWTVNRALWRQQALALRRRFDSNKNVSDIGQLNAIIQSAEDQLTQYRHPDPFIPPCRPGGTKFERNIPPPLDDPLPGHY